MDKREYLKSLGYNVGDRGRFSAEMKTAIKQAEDDGITFDNKAGKREDGLPMVEPAQIIPDVPPQVAVREARTLIGISPEGYKIAFITCSDCSYHMIYCKCEGGVKGPSSVVSSKDPLVRI